MALLLRSVFTRAEQGRGTGGWRRLEDHAAIAPRFSRIGRRVVDPMRSMTKREATLRSGTISIAPIASIFRMRFQQDVCEMLARLGLSTMDKVASACNSRRIRLSTPSLSCAVGVLTPERMPTPARLRGLQGATPKRSQPASEWRAGKVGAPRSRGQAAGECGGQERLQVGT
jgi:hypothetical protein